MFTELTKKGTNTMKPFWKKFLKLSGLGDEITKKERTFENYESPAPNPHKTPLRVEYNDDDEPSSGETSKNELKAWKEMATNFDKLVSKGEPPKKVNDKKDFNSALMDEKVRVEKLPKKDDSIGTGAEPEYKTGSSWKQMAKEATEQITCPYCKKELSKNHYSGKMWCPHCKKDVTLSTKKTAAVHARCPNCGFEGIISPDYAFDMDTTIQPDFIDSGNHINFQCPRCDEYFNILENDSATINTGLDREMDELTDQMLKYPVKDPFPEGTVINQELREKNRSKLDRNRRNMPGDNMNDRENFPFTSSKKTTWREVLADVSFTKKPDGTVNISVEEPLAAGSPMNMTDDQIQPPQQQQQPTTPPSPQPNAKKSSTNKVAEDVSPERDNLSYLNVEDFKNVNTEDPETMGHFDNITTSFNALLPQIIKTIPEAKDRNYQRLFFNVFKEGFFAGRKSDSTPNSDTSDLVAKKTMPIKVGSPVHDSELGDGTVTAIDGKVVTANFNGTEWTANIDSLTEK